MVGLIRRWGGHLITMMVILLVAAYGRLWIDQRELLNELNLQKLVYDRSAKETEKHRHQIRRVVDLTTVDIVRGRLHKEHPSPEEIADLVYRQSKVGKKNCHDLESSTGGLAMAVGGQEGSCAGFAVGYVKILRSFGFEARAIQLLSKQSLGTVSGRMDTHVTAEVKQDSSGQYMVVDPTFNVTFSCSNSPGDRLSVRGMQQCVQHGNTLLVHEGKTRIPGRTIAENYLPFEQYLFKAEVAKD